MYLISNHYVFRLLLYFDSGCPLFLVFFHMCFELGMGILNVKIGKSIAFVTPSSCLCVLV